MIFAMVSQGAASTSFSGSMDLLPLGGRSVTRAVDGKLSTRVKVSVASGAARLQTILVQVLDETGLPLKSFGGRDVTLPASELQVGAFLAITVCSGTGLPHHPCEVSISISQDNSAGAITRCRELRYPVLIEMFPIQ